MKIELEEKMSDGYEILDDWGRFLTGQQKFYDEVLAGMKARIEDLERQAVSSCFPPEPVEYLGREGDDWRPFPVQDADARVHAIKFDNGMVLDVLNGWRKP